MLTWQSGRWQVEHHVVPYDLERIRAAFQKSELLEEGGPLVRSFLLCIETGHNVADVFLKYAYGLAAEAGYKDCDVVPDDVWEHAAATFDWKAAAETNGNPH